MLLKEFKDLRHKRDKLRGLPDQLNYAIPIDDYTIALKDGVFYRPSTAPDWISTRRASRNSTRIAPRAIEDCASG